MQVSPQEEMANPQDMKAFAVERHKLFENFVYFRALCGVQSSPLVVAPNRECLGSATVAGTGRDSVFQVCGLPSCLLNLDDQTLVNRVSQLTWTLPLHAPVETVECASKTVEAGGRERLWSECEPKPVPVGQMYSTHTAQSPRANETASSIVVGD